MKTAVTREVKAELDRLGYEVGGDTLYTVTGRNGKALEGRYRLVDVMECGGQFKSVVIWLVMASEGAPATAGGLCVHINRVSKVAATVAA